jgi:threonyl-tRNA synthetase
MVIVGDREEKEGKVTIRKREGEVLENQDFGQFLEKLNKKIAQKE